MVTTKAIVIKDLSSRLSDIIGCVSEDYLWSLLWITAIGKPSDSMVLSFEEKVNKSSDGIKISRGELLELERRFNQITELLIIGDQDGTKLHRYSTDIEMYNKCGYVLELIDSSYWVIHTIDENIYYRTKMELKGAADFSEEPK